MALTNTSDIISKFELFIGDSTELSTTEELDLLQKVYNEVLASEDWEFLKKTSTGSISGTDITEPTDFDRLTSEQTIYIGSNNQENKQVPFGRRREYDNTNGFFYHDVLNGKFVFTKTQNNTYSFDYLYVPEALDTTTSNPVFPQRFWDMLYHAMCIDSDIINLSDKARSYAALNEKKKQDILNDMKTWNKKLSGYNTY